MKSKLLFKTHLVVSLILMSQSLAQACDCLYYLPVFCRNAQEQHNIVSLVVTKRINYHFMEAKLLENLHMEIPEDTIIILGQEGGGCGEILDTFNINDTLILALKPTTFEGISCWRLNGCGHHYLRYENGLVIGQVTDSVFNQPYEEFKDNLAECLAMPLLETKKFDENYAVNLFPNPVSDKFQISIERSSILSYELFNTTGQRIHSAYLDQSLRNLEVNAANFHPGVYYIRLYTSNGILTRRFLKT